MLKKATYCLLASLIIAAVLFLITLIGCSPEQVPETEQKIENEKYFSENQANILECSSEFGFKLLKQINTSKSVEENVFISPLSISLTLQTLLNGAENDTYDEIVETLGFTNSIVEINRAYKELLKKFAVQNTETIVCFSDSVCLNTGMTCKNEFFKTGRKVYGASFSLLDLLNTDNSKEIKTAIYSKNSASFISVWRNKFNTDKKVNLDFEKNNGEIKNIEFMTQKNNYHFYSDDLLSYVEIPYGNDSLFSMSIILPAIKRSVNQVISELDGKYWNSIINHRDYLNGQLIIPKFNFSYEAKLKPVLQKLGISEMFSNDARFKKIYNQNIFIDQIVHNSSIEINEKGLTASTISAFEMIKYSIGSAFYLIANRPFLVLIKENLSNEVLFVGKFVNP